MEAVATKVQSEAALFIVIVPQRLMALYIPAKIYFQTDNFISVKCNDVSVASFYAARLNVFVRNDNFIAVFYDAYIVNIFKVASIRPAFFKEAVSV